MLGLAVLEMAGFFLCRGAAERLVWTLREALRHRRNQRFLLFLADGRGSPGLAAPARKEKVHLHRQSERTHHSHQEVQGHKDAHPGFWHDRRYPRRSHGMFSVSAAAELPL